MSMEKPVVAAEPLDLTVRFVAGPPIDDVVYWIRRCAERYRLTGPLTVVLEPKSKPGSSGSKLYEVRVERPERVLVIERDRNLMLAVRHAFERLPVAALAHAHAPVGDASAARRGAH